VFNPFRIDISDPDSYFERGQRKQPEGSDVVRQAPPSFNDHAITGSKKYGALPENCNSLRTSLCPIEIFDGNPAAHLIIRSQNHNDISR
jgi:hypothetical protein